MQNHRAKQQYPMSGSESAEGLTRRKYAGSLRDLGDREWFAAVGESPQRWYVPLGTTELKQAELTAHEIKADFAAQGWSRLANRIPREFVFAVYWLEAPLAVTYVTLFTLPRTRSGTADLEPTAAARRRIAVIEADDILRGALIHWLGGIPGCTCVGWQSTAAWLRHSRHRPDADLLLVPRMEASVVADQLRRQRGGAELPLVLGHGIFPTSDDIFAAVSGVESGYFLRRRMLPSLFEPLDGGRNEDRTEPAVGSRGVRRYFQNLFAPDAAEDSDFGGLTRRERQILTCIQRGLRDKEIAATLQISPLTVHTHLKHVFNKLGVHTRTEAVVKFLEK